MSLKGMWWIHLAEDADQSRFLTNAVINLHVP
jgi:hypothetical protein